MVRERFAIEPALTPTFDGLNPMWYLTHTVSARTQVLHALVEIRRASQKISLKTELGT